MDDSDLEDDSTSVDNFNVRVDNIDDNSSSSSSSESGSDASHGGYEKSDTDDDELERQSTNYYQLEFHRVRNEGPTLEKGDLVGIFKGSKMEEGGRYNTVRYMQYSVLLQYVRDETMHICHCYFQ